MAASVTAAVAPEIGQMHGALHPPEAGGKNCVTGLVRPALNADAMATELQHLRHERKAIKPSLLIQRTEDLVCRPDLH